MLPFTYTGADLYALCSDAMLKAITRQASAVDAKIKALPNGPVTTAYYFDYLATPEDTAVFVTEDDFEAARRELVPSVSAKELEHYEKVRRQFESKDEEKDDILPRGLTNGLRATGTQNLPSNVQDGGFEAHGMSLNHGMSIDLGTGNLFDSHTGSGVLDEDEDEYVIKTDHLSLNDYNNNNHRHHHDNTHLNGSSTPTPTPTESKGKGRGKAIVPAARRESFHSGKTAEELQ